MNGLVNTFTIGFYNILRLCSLQFKRIALNFPLMVNLTNSWFQNCYCKCMSGKFIIECRVTQKKVGLRRQYMQTIISSLVILQYYKFCHTKSRICLHGTRSCIVMSATYMPKLFIHNYYHGVIVIWVRSTI